MVVKAPHRLRPLTVAARSVAALRTSPDVLAICLIGSVARGDARRDSDVDLLVVATQSTRALRAIVPPSMSSDTLSLIRKTPVQLHDLAARGSLFLAHVRTEGRVVHDPGGILASAFAAAEGVPLDIEGEIRRRRASLRHYRHLDRFGGNYLFALAHLYGIAKGLAMARCAEIGRTTFVKADALARLADARPALRSDIEFIQSLRPFYDVTRGHSVDTFPFAHEGASQEARRAVQATTRIAIDGR